MAKRTNTAINIPNILTLVRILLTPVFIILLLNSQFTLALFVFTLAGLSDALDGFIARYFNQRTVLGAYLDPLADKLLLLSAYVSLAILESVPEWLAVIVISRDLIIIMGIAILTITNKPYEVRPSIVSKLTTAIQISTIFLALLNPKLPRFETVQSCMFLATAAITMISGFHYIYIGMNQLQQNSTSGSPQS